MKLDMDAALLSYLSSPECVAQELLHEKMVDAIYDLLAIERKRVIH